MPRVHRYEEVAGELRASIHAGEHAVGGTLPRYEELTDRYGVGRTVIARAIGVLEREGLVRPVKRKGLVVMDWKRERRRIARGQVVRRDPNRGYVFPAARDAAEPWVVHGRPSRDYVPATPRVAELLAVDPQLPVLRRRRVTSPAGEAAFQVADTWIAPEAVRDAPRVAEADTGPGGYLDRLEEAGHGPLSWTEFTRVRMPDREEAQLLEISPELPVLELAVVGASASSGTPVEVTVRVIPSDRVELVSELRRARSAAWPTEPVSPSS